MANQKKTRDLVLATLAILVIAAVAGWFVLQAREARQAEADFERAMENLRETGRDAVREIENFGR